MGIQYKLIGFLNMFKIIPDFVLPIFEFNGKLYFQEGEFDTIHNFSLAKESVANHIIPLDSNSSKYLSSVYFDTCSKPIYAFQENENNVICGDSTFLKSFFKSYRPCNDILSSEIRDFLKDISLPKKETNISKPIIYQPKSPQYYGTGRRKTSTARVYLSQGNGNISINNRDINNYFGLQLLKEIVYQPLLITNNRNKFDVKCIVSGGGVTGQAGAISLGIARALLEYNENFRKTLKAEGLLTRDPRMKERKKYGLKAARKAPQYSKR